MKMSNNKCCICEEINTKKFPFTDVYKTESRILYETDSFIIMPSVSPLVTGHVLIFPKQHINNLVQLKDSELNRLFQLANEFYHEFLVDLGNIFILEHGVPNEMSAACGINHAHLHLMPLSLSAINKISQSFSTIFESQSISTFNLLRNEINFGNQYLMLNWDLITFNVAIKKEFTSQTMRKLISEELNLKSWNWKEFSNVNSFNKTINLVKY